MDEFGQILIALFNGLDGSSVGFAIGEGIASTSNQETRTRRSNLPHEKAKAKLDKAYNNRIKQLEDAVNLQQKAVNEEQNSEKLTQKKKELFILKAALLQCQISYLQEHKQLRSEISEKQGTMNIADTTASSVQSFYIDAGVSSVQYNETWVQELFNKQFDEPKLERCKKALKDLTENALNEGINLNQENAESIRSVIEQKIGLRAKGKATLTRTLGGLIRSSAIRRTPKDTTLAGYDEFITTLETSLKVNENATDRESVTQREKTEQQLIAMKVERLSYLTNRLNNTRPDRERLQYLTKELSNINSLIGDRQIDSTTRNKLQLAQDKLNGFNQKASAKKPGLSV